MSAHTLHICIFFGASHGPPALGKLFLLAAAHKPVSQSTTCGWIVTKHNITVDLNARMN